MTLGGPPVALSPSHLLSLTVASAEWRPTLLAGTPIPDLFFPVGTTGPAIEQIETPRRCAGRATPRPSASSTPSPPTRTPASGVGPRRTSAARSASARPARQRPDRRDPRPSPGRTTPSPHRRPWPAASRPGRALRRGARRRGAPGASTSVPGPPSGGSNMSMVPLRSEVTSARTIDRPRPWVAPREALGQAGPVVGRPGPRARRPSLSASTRTDRPTVPRRRGTAWSTVFWSSS